MTRKYGIRLSGKIMSLGYSCRMKIGSTDDNYMASANNGFKAVVNARHRAQTGRPERHYGHLSGPGRARSASSASCASCRPTKMAAMTMTMTVAAPMTITSGPATRSIWRPSM